MRATRHSSASHPASRTSSSTWSAGTIGGYEERYPALLEKLGPHKTGKGCLYLKRLAAVDQAVLGELIDRTARVHRAVGHTST